MQSRSGRHLHPPQVKKPIDTDRRAKAALKKMDAWLIEEARKEATEYELLLLPEVGEPLSPADRDLANDVLFGWCEDVR